MTIGAFATLLLLMLLPMARTTAQPVPFEICAESTTWTRPAPEVQAKIWNDNRYKDVAGTAYEWTHNFIITDPESASIQYHSMKFKVATLDQYGRLNIQGITPGRYKLFAWDDVPLGAYFDSEFLRPSDWLGAAANRRTK